MSTIPEVDGIVALPGVQDAAPLGADVEAPVEVAAAPAAPAVKAKRPGWIAPAAIAAVGLIVAGTLGFVLYSTIQQRDALHTQLVTTKGTLATTQAQLAAAQQDAAQKKVTADYVAVYVSDEGKVLTDYESFIACNGYSECRTIAQQFLSDMQQFQTDRKAANVPPELASADSSLGDALSAAIAGDQEMITGIDNGDTTKATDGGNKVDAAILNLGKAETAMGTSLK